MKKFERLTKYIPLLTNAEFGKWIVDHKNDGTKESPSFFPYVEYTNVVIDFIKSVGSFYEENPDYELSDYHSILKKSGIKFSFESMNEVEIAAISEQTILALLMAAIRAERFGDGILLKFLENGNILKWLQRLSDIDEG